MVPRLLQDLPTGHLPEAIATTMRRAGVGYRLALVIGIAIGLASCDGAAADGRRVSDHRAADDALDRMVPARDPALRTHGAAIMFVVVFGAAPSVANGLINGVDHVPRILLRAGGGARRRGASTATAS